MTTWHLGGWGLGLTRDSRRLHPLPILLLYVDLSQQPTNTVLRSEAACIASAAAVRCRDHGTWVWQ